MLKNELHKRNGLHTFFQGTSFLVEFLGNKLNENIPINDFSRGKYIFRGKFDLSIILCIF